MSLDVVSLVVLQAIGLWRGDGTRDGTRNGTMGLDVVSLVVLQAIGLWRWDGTRDGTRNGTMSLDVLGFWLVLLRALLLLHDSSFRIPKLSTRR